MTERMQPVLGFCKVDLGAMTEVVFHVNKAGRRLCRWRLLEDSVTG